MADSIFKEKIPFNIDLLYLSGEMLQRIPRVTTAETYEQNSNIFNRDGLFSTEIFGELQTQDRNERFGYIDLQLPVMHPLVYRHIIESNSMFDGIINGEIYVKYDSETKTFVTTNKIEGKTGISFFISNIDKFKVLNTGSEKRSNIVNFLSKYPTNRLLMNALLVIPAGLRDRIQLSENETSEDEINKLYRIVINASNSIRNIINSNNTRLIDIYRLKIQKTVLKIYEYIENILEGKTGFIQNKWLKRRIMFGTRNVLTSLPVQITKNDGSGPGFDDTVVGIYQFAAALGNATFYYLRSTFLDNIIDASSGVATVYDPNTYEKKMVEIRHSSLEKFVTTRGLKTELDRLIDDNVKRLPVTIDGYYLLLIYDDGENIRIVDDISEYDRKYVRPITYVELLFLSLIDVIPDSVGLVTRYPITGLGSIYPTRFYVKTTIKGRTVKYYRSVISEPITIYEYPILDSPFYNSMSVNITRLSRLGADFDGDKLSLTVLLEEESKNEVNRMLDSPWFYLTPTGELVYSASNDISDLILKIFTE